MNEEEDEAERVARAELVMDLRRQNVAGRATLAALESVPRSLFLDAPHKALAYRDRAAPIACGQTISQPAVVAMMTEALALEPHMRVLEIGTGSGYGTAVLAELSGQVHSVERLETLATGARSVLTSLGYENVYIVTGDGTLGWAAYAPYDAIVISAAAPCLPRPLLEQLKPGGCLVVPMGEQELQSLVRIRKTSDGLKEDYLGECHFVKLIGAYGDDDGWDAELGLKTEIVPLSKPFALWEGNLFQGIVKLDGAPVPYAEVEVEYYNEDGSAVAPSDLMITQTIKADADGVFSYAVPNSGWWGFAALNTAEEPMQYEGQDKAHELGAVIWVHFEPWGGR